MTRGVRSASEIALICALVGVVATAIKVSGLGIKLPLVIEEISGGFLPIALFIAMVSSILLGMGVPTTAAYLLVAIGAVPALITMGVPLLQAHMFCFIFAIFSHLTPPVAIGAMVASQIAEAEYWSTAWEAVKAGFTGLLLPFFVIYVPVLVLRPEGTLWQSFLEISGVLLGVSALQVGLSGYLLTGLDRIECVLFIIGSAFCMFSAMADLYALLAVGAVLCVVAFCLHFRRKTADRRI